jgi:UTP--glucose-1-phosphate uridylyltransferase
MRVRKAVIPAAGLGTRFLPVTLAVPKELLPLDRKPAIHHIVQEAVEAGLDTIVLVLLRGKESVAHYFLDNPLYGERIRKPEARRRLDEVQALKKRFDIVTVYQDEPLGLGHAVLCAAPAVGDEPFVLMLPDDLFSPSPLPDMIAGFERTGLGGVLVRAVGPEQVSRYGIVRVAGGEAPFYALDGAVEKPAVETAPSNLAIMGRYVLPAEVMALLAEARKGVNDEIQVTDSLDRLASSRGMFGLHLRGTYTDLGTWEGYVSALAAHRNPVEG